MKTICIIQARMGSTRLPGKIMLPILDKPMLWWDMYRVLKCRLIDEIVIATTNRPEDDATEKLCRDEGWLYYRGSEDDVLDRYYQTALKFEGTHIVRITSDCPLIDPSVIDYVISAYRSAAPAVDYASNVLARTYPRGLDTEVFSFAALERAWREDGSPWREHVTPYINRQPDQFRLYDVHNPVDYSTYRLTVDTPEDLMLVRHIYEYFGHGDFGWGEALKILEQHPDWVKINQDVQQKAI